jgi:hypothetical protein
MNLSHNLEIEPQLDNQASCMRRKKTQGILTILGGTLILLVAGSLYLWGNISLYIVSYFRSLGGHDDLTTKTASIILPVGMIIHNLITPVGAAMQKRYNPKIITSIGACIICSAFYISSYV